MGMHNNSFSVSPDILAIPNLSGNEKILLAKIQSFSASSGRCYISNRYIARLLGVSERTASKYVSKLKSEGLIKIIGFDGRKRLICPLACIFEPVLNDSSSLHGIIVPNNIGNEYISPKTMGDIPNNACHEDKFNFLESLLRSGVNPDVARCWLDVRKSKHAVNSKLAFEKLISESQKAGMSVNSCVRIAAENSWANFKADWIAPKNNKPHYSKESALSHNLKVMDAMFGTSTYESTYGKESNTKTDEQ